MVDVKKYVTNSMMLAEQTAKIQNEIPKESLNSIILEICKSNDKIMKKHGLPEHYSLSFMDIAIAFTMREE